MSSTYALPVPNSIYREEQRFGWWVYLLIAVILGLGWAFLTLRRDVGQADGGRFSFSLGVTLGIAIPGTFIVGVLKMTTEVHPGDVRVWFGWIPTYRRIINLSGVSAVEVVRYRPIRDCGGWGIRRGRGYDRVFSARGDQGVCLTFTDGSKILIGSQKPEPLALAIDSLIHPAG